MERPTTPPRRDYPNNLDVTPEKLRQIEINRLKAKDRLRQQMTANAAASSSETNAQNKRPMTVPINSTSPTAPKAKSAKQAKLAPDSRLVGKYVEYDLSKMHNSKGGFLIEDADDIDEDRRIKEKQRERQRQQQVLDPPIFLDASLNPRCQECDSVDIDQVYKKVFGSLVCGKCKNEKVEKYSLLTKTECKEDYLLTDPELRDAEILPHLLKANPHQSTYANMMLYLRCQVEDFAWKKWGSPEALDEEFERREKEKSKKKKKKFEEGLKDLRRKTREGVWQRRKDEEHKHIFGATEILPDGSSVQACTECGFTIDIEEF